MQGEVWRNFSEMQEKKNEELLWFVLVYNIVTDNFTNSYIHTGGFMKIVSFVVLLLFVSFSLQAQTNKDAKPAAMKGYLVDKMCGSSMAKKAPDQAMASAAKHTKSCALAESCTESGYGLMMDGKWTAFDNTGNQKAAAFLKSTKAKDHLFVAVTGEKEGEMIKVSSIKAAKATK